MREEEVEGEEEEDEDSDDDESEEDDGAEEPDDAVLTALVDAEAALRKNPASYNAHMKVGFRLLASSSHTPLAGASARAAVELTPAAPSLLPPLVAP